MTSQPYPTLLNPSYHPRPAHMGVDPYELDRQEMYIRGKSQPR